jgi:hypothetical protein
MATYSDQFPAGSQAVLALAASENSRYASFALYIGQMISHCDANRPTCFMNVAAVPMWNFAYPYKLKTA